MQQDTRNKPQIGAYPNQGQAPFPAPGFSSEEDEAQETEPAGYPFDEQDFFGDVGQAQRVNTGAPLPDTRERSAAARRNGLLTILLTFAVLCVAVLVLNAKVLRLQTVTVHGATTIPESQIASLAGLEAGTSFLSIDETHVQEAVNANRYLEFIRLEKHFPNAVVLTVRERTQRANLMVMGVMYILDEQGMVLERSSSMALDNGLLTVTGMQTKEIKLGRVVSPQKSVQLENYTAVISELIEQQYAGQISELNLSNLENLYLITIDGYTVNIGNAADIRAKIGTMRAVVTKLREMGKTGGVIEASLPGEATYSPPNL